MNQSQNARIFVSYSHRGNGPTWKAALLRALQVFERQHLLDVWQDGKIRVSSFWDGDIKQAMSDARLSVVLLTQEALESDYILNEEFPYLRDRQQNDNLTVFPVVCEECNWRAHDWLRATQAPNGSSPIATLKSEAQERVFRQLATDIAEQLSRSALDELPKGKLSETRVYLDKFPLTHSTGLREERLIGREQELALLDLAFAQPHTAIVSLVAWGGVGKTMLVQHWLRRLQSEGWFGAQCVYAWSFYSQGTTEDRQASEDMFLAHALEWFGVQCEPTLSPWDKGRLLADAVARDCTLLILDGIEPLQYPPGPMGGQLRAPGVQSLLKQLARKADNDENLGLCLVTTREPLTDLADFQRHPNAAWGSVLRVDLGNLTEEAGAALLHHAGANRAGAAEIKPDDTELLAASREVDGHALTLNLLGRFLARGHGGDIRRRDLVKFEEADRKEKGGTTFKMLAAFENWFNRPGGCYQQSLAILRMLGLFDRPVDSGCTSALRKPPTIVGLTDSFFQMTSGFMGWGKRHRPLPDEDWYTASSFLADFGLVVIQADANDSERLLDCHPLIREHFAKQLCNSDPRAWRSAHLRLYQHLKQNTEDHPNTLEELQPLYQAVAHGCQAKLHQEACDVVFRDRIRRGTSAFSLRELGAYSSDLQAVACFFDRPWTRTAPDLIQAAQAWLLNESAYDLRALGRLTEAVGAVKTALAVSVRQEDWVNAPQEASTLSELELTLGAIANALRDAEQSVAYAERSGIMFHRIGRRATLADALHQAGDKTRAVTCFREAEALQAKEQPEYPLLYSFSGYQFGSLLLGETERAVWKLSTALLGRGGSEESGTRQQKMPALERCDEVEQRTTKTRMWEGNGFRDGLLERALDQLSLGRSALYRAILIGSIPSSHQSLRRQLAAIVDALRHAGQEDVLPLGLLSHAWLCCLSGDAVGARADLDEAWDIAERGLMRLHLADIHLHRARLFFREKPYPWKSPQDDLAAAEKLINDCGYHRRDEELADAKRAILGS